MLSQKKYTNYGHSLMIKKKANKRTQFPAFNKKIGLELFKFKISAMFRFMKQLNNCFLSPRPPTNLNQKKGTVMSALDNLYVR